MVMVMAMVIERGQIVVSSGIIDDGVCAWEGDEIIFVGEVEHFKALVAKGSVTCEENRTVAAVYRRNNKEKTSAGGATVPDNVTLPAPTRNIIMPGLVDEHVHGGGGVSFPDATTLGDIERGAHEHFRNGTTSIGAAMTTMSVRRMEITAGLLADAADKGVISQIMIEGPFLSHQRAGAQNPAHIIEPSVQVADRIINATRGYAYGMAFAPEIEGADAVVSHIIGRGLIPTWGHTHCMAQDAHGLNDYAVGLLRERGSARVPVVNHLFNAMRELRHRSPGPIGEFLAAAARDEAMVEFIADGKHVSMGLVRNIIDILGPDRVCLISDAIAAAGMPDGTYELGGLQTNVVEGIARLRGGNLAGGTWFLLDIVRALYESGVRLVDCVQMATMNPARVMGLENVGELAVGKRADVLVCGSEGLGLLKVYRAGREVPR